MSDNPIPPKKSSRPKGPSKKQPERPTLPDQLSTDVRSKYHDKAIFEHNIGIHFNDKERVDVEEYCISEGWIKVPVGNKVDRKGFPLTIKLKGKVEAFYK